MNNLSIYIHIPFCVRKCNYCDFLSAPCEEKTKQEYVEALCREIEQRAEQFKNRKVDTVFFGGGTPSILSAGQIEKVMLTIKSRFHILDDAEISMEMNPGTVDTEKLEIYKKLGINRLSIGLQSADNEELKVLGRIHTWEDFLKTWKLVREMGFSNVNIDLMSALPGQTLESYEKTLRKVLALKPEHISAYSLIIEEGTLFYEWFGENAGKENQVSKEEKTSFEDKKIPDEITDRKMYEMTKKLLEEQGYFRYEISNYALKGYECKHNIGYWKRKEYLGLGLGAASLISNVRFSNIVDMQVYLKIGSKQYEMDSKVLVNICKEKKELYVSEMSWIGEQQPLTLAEQIEEFMFLGLRMMEGVSPEEFEKIFGKTMQEVYGKQIEELMNKKLLMFDKNTQRYALTLQGIDVSNQVFVEFLE